VNLIGTLTQVIFNSQSTVQLIILGLMAAEVESTAAPSSVGASLFWNCDH
jgi:hypothetical protein